MPPVALVNILACISSDFLLFVEPLSVCFLSFIILRLEEDSGSLRILIIVECFMALSYVNFFFSNYKILLFMHLCPCSVLFPPTLLIFPYS